LTIVSMTTNQYDNAQYSKLCDGNKPEGHVCCVALGLSQMRHEQKAQPRLAVLSRTGSVSSSYRKRQEAKDDMNEGAPKPNGRVGGCTFAVAASGAKHTGTLPIVRRHDEWQDDHDGGRDNLGGGGAHQKDDATKIVYARCLARLAHAEQPANGTDVPDACGETRRHKRQRHGHHRHHPRHIHHIRHNRPKEEGDFGEKGAFKRRAKKHHRHASKSKERRHSSAGLVSAKRKRQISQINPDGEGLLAAQIVVQSHGPRCRNASVDASTGKTRREYERRRRSNTQDGAITMPLLASGSAARDAHRPKAEHALAWLDGAPSNATVSNESASDRIVPLASRRASRRDDRRDPTRLWVVKQGTLRGGTDAFGKKEHKRANVAIAASSARDDAACEPVPDLPIAPSTKNPKEGRDRRRTKGRKRSHTGVNGSKRQKKHTKAAL